MTPPDTGVAFQLDEQQLPDGEGKWCLAAALPLPIITNFSLSVMLANILPTFVKHTQYRIIVAQDMRIIVQLYIQMYKFKFSHDEQDSG